MVPFERAGRCTTCGAEYVVSGNALFPGAETEGPAHFRCECGGSVEALVPGSVNPERMVVMPKVALEGVGGHARNKT